MIDGNVYIINQVMVSSKSADALVIMHRVINTHNIGQMYNISKVSLAVIVLGLNMFNMFYISIKRNYSVL